MDSVRMKSTIVAIVIVGLGMWELIVEVTVSSWKSWVEIFILQFFLLKFTIVSYEQISATKSYIAPLN